MRNFSKYAAVVIAFLCFAVNQAQGQLINVAETALDFGCVAVPDTVDECFSIQALDEDVDYTISITGDAGFTLSGFPSGQVLAGTTIVRFVRFDPMLAESSDAKAILSIVITDPVNDFPTVKIVLDATCGTPESPGDLIGDILVFFDASIANGTIESTGPMGNKRYRAFRNRIKAIDFLIQRGCYEHASYITRTAIERSDGSPDAKDFIQGTSVPELNNQLVFLKYLLDQ